MEERFLALGTIIKVRDTEKKINDCWSRTEINSE